MREDGGVVCWGDLPARPLNGRFRQIAVGGSAVCGVPFAGPARCWTRDGHERSTLKQGYVAVAVGPDLACGLNVKGRVECWDLVGAKGDRFADRLTEAELNAEPEFGNDDALAESPGEGTMAGQVLGSEFRIIALGSGFACGVRTDGKLGCWGSVVHWPDDWDPAEDAFNIRRYVALSAAGVHVCAVSEGGAIDCWINRMLLHREDIADEGQAQPPRGVFLSVAAGRSHTLGLSRNGTIRCWGSNLQHQCSGPVTR
jgi:alpha-tubulin suppressor-like RCC1 family protein